MTQRPVDVEQELERLHEESFGWALACSDFDHAEAEDVLQMTYVRVISGQAAFGGRSTFRTWLFGVIRLVAAERRRRSRRRERLAAAAGARIALVVQEEPADEAVERSEGSRRLLAALACLPERQRQILHLVFYEGMSVAEAAGVLGIGVGSARTHYARAKDRMRTILGSDLR